MNIHQVVQTITNTGFNADDMALLALIKNPIALALVKTELKRALPLEEAESLIRTLDDIAAELQGSYRQAAKSIEAKHLAFMTQHNPEQLEVELKSNIDRQKQVTTLLNNFVVNLKHDA